MKLHYILMIFLLKKHLVNIVKKRDNIDELSILKIAYKHYIQNIEGTILLLKSDLESIKNIKKGD